MSSASIPNPTQNRSGLLGWLAAGSALVLLGMVAGASLWLYAAYAAVAAGNYFLARAWAQNPSATRRTGPLEVETGAVVPIEIQVTNRGRFPIAWLLVEDLLPRAALMYNPPALAVEGERLRLMYLATGKSSYVEY